MSPSSAPDPSTVSLPGYSIHRLLGQGGMATVYLATQEKLKRQVALKVILPQHAADEEFRERFVTEGQLTARLFHRHIMAVFDIGEANGYLFLATELLPGGTLAERLPSIHSVVEKLLIVRDVAEGLGFAHANQVIHRDIKPGNILFRNDGTAVVADFGIAKALDVTRAHTMQGMIVGTPSYMSPEQVQGQPLDGRSDLYSVGIMFYQMLTGELPFVAADLFAVAMAQIARPAPPLPPRLAPLQPLLDSMLAKLPDQRIASAEALCAAIDVLLPSLDDAALSGEAIERRPAQPRISRQTPAVSAALSRPKGAALPETAGRRAARAAERPWWRWPLGAATAAALGLAIWAFWPAPQVATSPPGGELPTAGLGADEAWLSLARQVRERIDQRRYFSPAGGSAHDALILMLRERPTDIDALELAAALPRAVAADATRALEAGNRTQAGLLLSEARVHFANDPSLLALERQLSGERPTVQADDRVAEPGLESLPIDTLRQRAAAALAAARISSPPGDNAVAYYRAILRLAPDDREAGERLRQIAADYAAAAQGWLDAGNPGQANAAALRGLEALPGDPTLERLRELARAGE